MLSVGWTMKDVSKGNTKEMIDRIPEILDGLDCYLSELYEVSVLSLSRQEDMLSQEEIEAVKGLLDACHETECAIMLLLRNRLIFDAIALTRSLAEGTVRVLYMMSPSFGEVHNRIKEYIEELPRDTYANLGRRARSISDESKSCDADYQKMVTELARIESDKTPDMIRSRWSFANIFKDLRHEQWGATRLSRVQILYALSSDILHKGYIACQMRQEAKKDYIAYISAIMFLLYDLADMRCEVVAGPTIAAPLSEKYGAVVCAILAMNAAERNR